MSERLLAFLKKNIIVSVVVALVLVAGVTAAVTQLNRPGTEIPESEIPGGPSAEISGEPETPAETEVPVPTTPEEPLVETQPDKDEGSAEANEAGQVVAHPATAEATEAAGSGHTALASEEKKEAKAEPKKGTSSAADKNTYGEKSDSDRGGSSSVKQVSLDAIPNISSLSKGDSSIIDLKVTPQNAAVSAQSSNSAVAEATVLGGKLTVTGKNKGTATITVTATAPGYLPASQTFTVTVVESGGAVILGAIPNISSLAKGDFSIIDLKVTPQNAAVSAKSSNSAVAEATVSGSKLTVTGKNKGTATITVTAAAPGYLPASQTFTVSVVEPAAAVFNLYKNDVVSDIYVSAADHKQVVRAVGDLKNDIEAVTGKTAAIHNTSSGLKGHTIIVGSVESSIIKDLISAGKLDEAKSLQGKWESFIIKQVDNPLPGVEKGLVIAGSDPRGTAFGIYDLSEQIGVSPWYYWGDILPVKQSEIIITQKLKQMGEPSVKYRGIFINDEQNLADWAKINDAKGKEGGNIGPETYEKVFELLLRLKANYLWPAMHSEPRLGPSDHFNKYPENRQLADDYGIIIGTSHCEPMMRNGTTEYVAYHKSQGLLQNFDFENYGKSAATKGYKVGDMWKYVTTVPGLDSLVVYDYSIDKDTRGFIDGYWSQGVDFYKDFTASYTLGMRGLHDDGFVASKATTQAAKLQVLQDVIDSQTKMLEKNNNPDSISIFIPYKEVLPLYDAGLKLPDETVIVWSEDNHGYIRRFPNEAENQRSGGNGVYYHLNYVGTQTYVWLNSTPPALILSEMGNAYDSGIQQLWVLNVGGIKPREIGTEFFLDMAWDIGKWTPENLNGTATDDSFFAGLSKKWFPDADADEVAEILNGYFRLNLARKPEHTTLSEARNSVFDPVNYGDESMQRLAEYQDLTERCGKILKKLETLGDYQADAFYQHVAYPVTASYYNNLKYYHAQKNLLYNQQGRYAAANFHAELVDWAENQEKAATAMYNTGISGGKWDRIMQPDNFLRTRTSVKPTGMVVNSSIPYASLMDVVAEGELSPSKESRLAFSSYMEDIRFIDVYNMGALPFEYEAASDQSWVVISEDGGTVYDDRRIFITIDWEQLPEGDQTAVLTVKGAGTEKSINIEVENPDTPRSQIKGYAEAGGVVAIEAEHYTSSHKDGNVGFFVFDGLGRMGGSVSAGPKSAPNYFNSPDKAPYLTYDVYFQSAGSFKTTIYRVPSLDGVGQRIRLGVDDESPILINGQHIAESGNWQSNITNGIEKISAAINIPSPGYHTIKLYMVDAGVSIDRIVIDTGGEVKSNHGPAESYHSDYNKNPGVTPQLLSMHKEVLDAIIKTAETQIAAYSNANQADAHAFLSAELAAVKETLADGKGDTVKRGCARLKCALITADVIVNLDTLFASSLAKGEAILNADTSFITRYSQEAVAGFKPVYDRIKGEWKADLPFADKLALYQELETAIALLKANSGVTITASNVQMPNLPENVFDGDMETRWASVQSTYPQWIEIDLGEAYELSEIEVAWYKPPTGTRVYKYEVLTSMDGKNYTRAVDRLNNTASYIVKDSMDAVGRYVKVNVTGSNGGNASIYEIKLKGTKAEGADEALLNELKALIEDAKGAELNHYTVDSYEVMMNAVSEGEVLTENGAAKAVRESIDKITAAKANLKKRDVLIYDDFQVGSLAELDGWSFLEDGGNVTLETEGDNSFLKIAQDTKESSVEARRDVGEITGKVYIEAMVRSDSPATFFGAPYFYGNQNSSAILAAIALRDNGIIRASHETGSASMTEVGRFTSGQWVKLCVILNADTQKMHVYIGDKLAAADLTMRTAMSKLSMLRYYSDDKNNAPSIGYLDNLTVYKEAEPSGVTKVALIGDSLTAGSGVSNENEKYPAQLQGLLGPEYLVGNFGVSGATMVNGGTDSAGAQKGYIHESKYLPSKSFLPDIVVIMLGTNDSKALNWDTMSGDYVNDALSLIESYKALPSAPEVYIASSAKIIEGANSFGIQGDIVHAQIVPLQKQIAQIAGCGFIDVHEATKDATAAQFPDKVHGNVHGYEMIAKAVHKGLSASSKPKAPAIESSAEISLSTALGQKPAMPFFAPVTYEDGSSGIAEIIWDLAGLSFDSLGTVTVPGKVKGLDIPASAKVKVEEMGGLESELREIIDEAEDYAPEDYTPDSYHALKVAVANGEAKLSSGASGEFRAAITAIETAIDNLAERDYIVNDNFNSFADMDEFQNAGWDIVETGGDVTLETIGGKQYLKLKQTTKDKGTSVEAHRNFEPTGGKFYVESKIMAEPHNAGFGAPYVLHDSVLSNANVLGFISFRNASDITVGNEGNGGGGVTPIGQYKKDEWNTVCMVFDTSTYTTETYINGELKASGLFMRNNIGTASLLRFYCDDNNIGRRLRIVYFADVRVYKELKD